ncbi:Inositol-1-monophosphatase [Paragonimus heterotremus]|uniref:Inositol-1-monophosphatase n=1 Tax=Paragonimus heterotremus TaxID=100268 RepID=A0A8J4SNM2_9TREM|nr:Inositol-1-monophosphatase [Paragonimus heterotremus]
MSQCDLGIFLNRMVSVQLVKRLALKAGALIRENYDVPLNVDEKASYADLVTEVDKNVEEVLKTEILSLFPGHKIIAEEGYTGNAVLTDDPTWIIDPIDGTSNFVSKFPFVCVSIGYYIQRVPQISVVYNPILNCLYHAEKGCGAFRNDSPIHASPVKDLSEALVLTDWGGDRNPQSLDTKALNMRQIIAKARGVRTMGSAALHICQVAAGNGDVFYEFGIHCWDYAAALLIVLEAGGYCCNFDGSAVDLMARNVICAGTPELAQSLVKLIQPVGYPRD